MTSAIATGTLAVLLSSLSPSLLGIADASAAVVAGKTPTTFDISASGAATYRIPIWSPPGVGDIRLDLALAYNSRSPNGVMGVGWSIAGLSAITRCNKTWAQDNGSLQGILLSLSDRFCMDGQQLKLVSGMYGQAGSVYATEIESFSKIEAIGTSGNGPSSFKVTTKNGLIYEYGLTADAQIKPGGGPTIQTWALSRTRDRALSNGTFNKITFTYTNDTANNSYRVASIAYPTTASGQGPFYEVVFAYAARPTNDIPSFFSAGYISREPNRLTTITIRNFGSATATKMYKLLYGQGATTNRSTLTSVQECSATNCLVATSVAYQAGSAGWTSTLWTTPFTTSNAAGVGPLPIDLNGDGLSDIVYPKTATGTTSRWWANLATTSGYGIAIDTGVTTTNNELAEIVGTFNGTRQQQLLMKIGSTWSLIQYNPGGFFTTTSTGISAAGEYAAVDYDGDGLSDIASVVGNEIRVRHNTTAPPGAVTFAATPETIATFSLASQWSIWGSTSSRISMADFDGNGRGDLTFASTKTSGHGDTEIKMHIVMSNGFGVPATHTQFDTTLATLVPGDWNADGCTDILLYGGVMIASCGGSGFGASVSHGVTAASTLVVDWDGDGRTDLLYVDTSNNTWYVVRSTGDGFVAAVSTGMAAPVGTSWFVFDQNGDGLVDLGYRDAGLNPAVRYRLHNGSSTPADLATSFTEGFGINQSPTYKSISRSNYTKYTDASFPEQDFHGPLYVVGDLTGSDGIGGAFTQIFHYYGGRFHAQGRGFEGFYARRMTDSRDNLYNYDYLGRAFPYTGMLVGQTMSTQTAEVRKWTSAQSFQTLGAAGIQQRYFPFLASRTYSEFEVGGASDGDLVAQRVVSQTFGDGYGNPTIVATSTTDKDLSSPFSNLTWQTTVTTTYTNNVAQNCFGLPLTSEVQSSVPGQTTQTRHYNYVNSASLCRMTKEIIEPDIPELKVTTTRAFDSSCGNLQSIQVVGSNPDGTPMAPRTTTLGFGSRCQLPETVTNALNQPTAITYFYDFGTEQSVADPNGFLTTWQIDDFGRRKREDRPDGTATVWTYARCASPPCWGAADLRLRVTEDQRDTSNSSFNTRQLHYDAMNRLRIDETNRVLGVWTRNEAAYDALGRLVARYQPTSSTSSGRTTWTFDVLGRVQTQNVYQGSGALDRSTIYQYAGRTTSITDPLNRVSEQVRDVAGRLRQVIDPTPGGTTEYEYDVFGNLNRIKDPINAVSTGIYNLRGFRTTWADADRGSWTFVPNSLNELVSRTNAKGQNFSATYDLLGRLTSRTEPEGTSSFVWGSVATENNIGSLKSKSGYGYLEELYYDGSGRPITRTITTDQPYTYSYAYNSIGAIDTITYPTSPIPSGQTGSRFKIKYSYSSGVPFKIENVTQSQATTLWTLNSANDYSSPLTETLGTTPTTTSVTNSYQPWTNELTSVQSGVGLGLQTNRQNLAYDWDLAGNLERRQDVGQGLTEVFTPDPLNRVLSSTLNGTPNLTMTYDAAGNIKSKTGISGTFNYTTAQTGCTYYSHSQPHAVRKAGSVVYCYDQNGNVTKRDGLSQTWASFDLPTTLQASVNGSTYQSQFNYGPDHQRWRQVSTYSNGTETTHYVGDLLEKVNSTDTGVTYWRHYVPIPSGLTAIVSRNSDNSTWTTFALSDHLGSSDTLLDIDGTLLTRLSFQAFGARRGSNWTTSTPPDWTVISETTRRGFTFHEMLDNIGIIHMNGRVYDPTVGRFFSVDPLIGNPSDSQSINPYSYVGNRPLTSTDPTGYCVDGCFTFTIFVGLGIGDIFGIGSHRLPPPPATTFPGSSAQTGMNVCDPGMSSPSCGGSYILNMGPTYIPTDVVVDYAIGVKEYVRYDYFKWLLDLQRIKFVVVSGDKEIAGCLWVFASCNYAPTKPVLENAAQVSGYRHGPYWVIAAEIALTKRISAIGEGAAATRSLPVLPKALTVGANAKSGIHVYHGVRNGKVVYCGITCDLAQRARQHGSRFTELDELTRTAVTRGEARAIEEALILRNRGENVRHSISPKHPWYQEAVDWGEAWLREHGY